MKNRTLKNKFQKRKIDYLRNLLICYILYNYKEFTIANSISLDVLTKKIKNNNHLLF